MYNITSFKHIIITKGFLFKKKIYSSSSVEESRQVNRRLIGLSETAIDRFITLRFFFLDLDASKTSGRSLNLSEWSNILLSTRVYLFIIRLLNFTSLWRNLSHGFCAGMSNKYRIRNMKVIALFHTGMAQKSCWERVALGKGCGCLSMNSNMASPTISNRSSSFCNCWKSTIHGVK